VVAFVVDRVQLINARFGYAVGDQILVLLRDHLAKHLQAGDQLFRWTGPVFLALLDRPNLPDGVRAEVKRITSVKLETTVQIGTRSVLLPVASTSAIFSLFEIDSMPLLIEQIDAFVAGHLRR
jgi:GGDEF domain-containing protein